MTLPPASAAPAMPEPVPAREHSKHAANHSIPAPAVAGTSPVPAMKRSCGLAAFAMMRCSFAAAAIAAAAGAANAQSTAPPPPATQTAAPVPGSRPASVDVNAAFDRADENHDARLDRSEAERFPAVAQRFGQIDTNRDAYLSREEFTKAVSGS